MTIHFVHHLMHASQFKSELITKIQITKKERTITFSPPMQLFLRLFRPLVRMMLRQHIGAGEAIQGLKEIYVEVAEEQLRTANEKPTNSRISVLTGLDRNEVSRIRRGVDRQGKPVEGESPVLFLNRAARIVTNWPKKTDGVPVDLPYAGPNSFSELVKQYSGGIPANSVLEELQRHQSACLTENGDIRLLNQIFVPSTAGAKLEIASQQLSRLIDTIDQNIGDGLQTTGADAGKRYVQLELVFKNLTDSNAEFFCQLSQEQVQEFLKGIALKIKEQRIATNDTYFAPDEVKRHTGLGIYFFDSENKE